MKKNQIISFLLAFLLLCSVSVMCWAKEPETAVSAGSHSLKASVPLAGSEKLLDTAQAVIAYELNTDTLLYTWNADKRINPTGMVKLLTALIVLERGNLDDMVTVYRSTLDTIAWGAVSAGLKAGEQVPLRDLLLCVMVASANDAAAVMAAHIAGTQKEFVKLMNEKAAELGCTNSNFTNVHGLYDQNQYSTARDLAIIAEAALENEIFCEMFSLDNFSMAATNLSGPRYFITTNYMMSDEYMNQYFDYRVTGGKPAAASGSDRSMICTAEVGNSRYLLVVMSVYSQVSEDGMSVITFGNFEETKRLMNFVFNNYTVRQVLGKEQALYQYSVSNGQNDVVLRPERDVWVLLPADYDKDAVQYDHIVEQGDLVAPIATSDRLGRLQIRYQGLILADCDLVAMNPSAQEDAMVPISQRTEVEKEQSENLLQKLFVRFGVAIVALAVLAVLIYMLVKTAQNLKIRRMQDRRMRKWKRSR